MPTPCDGEELELTILMPCLNEARTVQACISAARGFLASHGVKGEVLVADNGSTDGSDRLAAAAGARVIRVDRRGYGAALMAGVHAARGRCIIMGDADESYDFSTLAAFVARLRSGAELVMGNRFKGGIEPGAMPALHRHLGNPVLSFIGRRFFRIAIGDFHCGLRGFSRESILRLSLATEGMEFASEMVAKAALAGLRIEEVPTVLRPDGRGRPPHLRTWRDGWRHLRFLLLFCPRWLFLYPGVALFLVGAMGFLALQSKSVVVASIGLDIHSLLYMAGAVIVGLQLVQLAVLTKWIGVMAGVVPKPRWLERVERFGSIEMGLLVGAALLVAGCGWSVSLVDAWSSSGFGNLDPRSVMRHAIPAVTLVVLGTQTAAGALFAGAVALTWRSSPSHSKA
ncbi:glycosyltransferase family 2 protein [Ramlibacter rhizophilus]|uniref:Glycosyltransferase family 2 protein n=2 Tax=Ramlibacter rhizophilus TaxID=1781167 RepID=A0A4Z0BJ34_9BURK|nr:glycosyltransferase family 2 protein [Ramlibacter rhizophilus]